MMKNLLLIILFFSSVFFAKAQETNNSQIYNKKGIAILPEKGDWVIGIDAAPFLDYIGNVALISSEENNAPEFAFTAQRPGQLFAKYYIKDDKALRLGLRLGITLRTDKDGSPSDPNEIDKFKENSLNIGVSFGVENYRTIRGRLRGFWGYEAGFDKIPYYGDDYYGTRTVTGKVTNDQEGSVSDYTESGGNTFDIFVKGLVGIEYFIAPKISLSGEFGIGLSYINVGEREFEPDSGSKVIYDAGSSELSVANTASGALVLLFHF